MKVNLRTFEMLTVGMIILGLILALSLLPEVRIFGYLLLVYGSYLLHQVGEERKRRRKRHAFYQRMERLMGSYAA